MQSIGGSNREEHCLVRLSNTRAYRYKEWYRFNWSHNAGGVSGFLGPVRKAFRWGEKAFLAAIKKQASKKPDLLLLHEGPDFPEPGFQGNEAIRKTLESSACPLVCFGHVHWKEPLRILANGTQFLNLEGRTILLTKELTSV